MIKNDQHFLQVAFKSYDNPRMVSTSEFDSDLKRFGYLNSMLMKYTKDKDETKLRICVNHVVILSNSFCKSAAELIRYKILKENEDLVETIMYFLKMASDETKPNSDILNILERI